MRLLGRRPASEALGTALLLVLIVGSGIAVERLGTDPAAALFAHAVTVGLGLAALIALLGPVSGAHFNPAVTLGFWRTGGLPAREVMPYLAAQVAGAVVGTVVAQLVGALLAIGAAIVLFPSVTGELADPALEEEPA